MDFTFISLYFISAIARTSEPLHNAQILNQMMTSKPNPGSNAACISKPQVTMTVETGNGIEQLSAAFHTHFGTSFPQPFLSTFEPLWQPPAPVATVWPIISYHSPPVFSLNDSLLDPPSAFIWHRQPHHTASWLHILRGAPIASLLLHPASHPLVGPGAPPPDLTHLEAPKNSAANIGGNHLNPGSNSRQLYFQFPSISYVSL